MDVSSTNHITGYIEWSESDASIEDNTSVVTASLVYHHGGGVATGNNSSNFRLSINGDEVKRTNGYTLYPGNTYTVLTHTVTVKHDADGTKKIEISGGGGIKGTTGLADSSGEAVVELSRVPRTVWVANGSDKSRGIASIRVGGEWKDTVPYVNDNGTWKVGV
jgi:hypothetical protein